MNDILNDTDAARSDVAEAAWYIERAAERLMSREHEWADAGVPEHTREVLADGVLDAIKAIEALHLVTLYAVDQIAKAGAR